MTDNIINNNNTSRFSSQHQLNGENKNDRSRQKAKF